MKGKKIQPVALGIVNPNCAGIDVGSKEHFVATGENAEEVRSFGVYTEDNIAMSNYLREKGVTSIALESTGTYWQNLFSHLLAEGFEVILVNGNQVKNVKGRKTDVLDSQWIQKIHSLGLLTGSFLPDSTTETIRTYTRHKYKLIEDKSKLSNQINQSLRLLNMRIDVVIDDVTGLTGRKIVSAFLAGETRGEVLADFRHPNCKKSKAEIAKALQYNGRKDYMFTLKQQWEMLLMVDSKIAETDKMIGDLLVEIVDRDEKKNNI